MFEMGSPIIPNDQREFLRSENSSPTSIRRLRGDRRRPRFFMNRGRRAHALAKRLFVDGHRNFPRAGLPIVRDAGLREPSR